MYINFIKLLLSQINNSEPVSLDLQIVSLMKNFLLQITCMSQLHSPARRHRSQKHRTNKPLRIWDCCKGEVAPIWGQCVRDVLYYIVTHITLKVHSICKKNFSSDYKANGFHTLQKDYVPYLCCLVCGLPL